MGTVFTLGSVSGADTSSVTATAADVLNPKVFVDGSGVAVTGAMTNRGNATRTIPYGTNWRMEPGYYNGDSVITAGEFSFSGNAGVSNVLSGKTFYSNSSTLQTGTMANQGTWNGTTSYGGSVTIPAGYHNGSGKVTGGTMSFSGNAEDWAVISGFTFYSNSSTRQTGTLPDFRGANLDYSNLTTTGETDGRFRIMMYNWGAFNANSYVSLDMDYMLSTLASGTDDRSSGNVIRKGPSTSYGTGTYHYTGRTGGNGRWYEVIVYGWQYR